MKSYRLVYTPETKEKRFLFTNVNVKELAAPISISREKALQEEVSFGSKKKSEQIEYEDEGYRRLKEKESSPLVLEDSENRVFTGKMQDLGINNACYFAFVNTGTSLKVVPIRKWYRFSQKPLLDVLLDGDAESAANEAAGTDSEGEEKEEIDFDEEFDDDDGEEAEVFVVREKKLSSAGRKMRNIMESYEEKEQSSEEKEKEKDAPRSSPERVLTKGRIREMFRGGRAPLRDLLKSVKMQFGLEDAEKALVKEFIAESCVFETDGGERYLVLKK